MTVHPFCFGLIAAVRRPPNESSAITQAEASVGPQVGLRGLLIRLDQIVKQQPVAYDWVGDKAAAGRRGWVADVVEVVWRYVG
jgi:hypothetical protein